MDILNERQISRKTRIKMARTAKRSAPKRQRARKRKERRMKTREQLKAAAFRSAKDVLVKKIAGGRKYGELSIGQKEKIDKFLATKKGVIHKVARKMLPVVKKREIERLKKVRSKGKPTEQPQLNEAVDPLTIASIVAITGGAVAITATLAKKLHDVLNRSVDFKVAKTYELIKRKYPSIFVMIRDQRFGRGKLQKMVRDMEDEIPGLKKKTFMDNITNIIDQLMAHHNWATSSDTSGKLDPERFQRESADGKHGVLTLNVNGSQPEVSARYVNGKLKPYVFKTRKDAKKHTDKVGGKPFESMDTGLFYVEFTKLDGPVNEYVGPTYKTANEIKKEWKKQYPNDKFTFKKVRAKGSEWLLVLSPKGVELERYQHVPKTGWIEMNENKDNEEDIKSLQAILDVATDLSPKNPYFKGRGSKEKYIKMLVHKIQKLSEAKKQKLMTRMDAYKKVRKSTMPKSRPMKNKKAYDRKALKKGKYD